MEDQPKSNKLIETGIQLIGSAAGVAVGILTGPVGPFLGSAAGIVITRGLSELANRYMSNREEVRVGASAAIMVTGINKKLAYGETLRNDGFFERNEYDRSNADELIEGTWLKCKNEYEERKISFISRLFENVAFDETITPGNANQILNIAELLSYRQFQLLAFVISNKDNGYNVRLEEYNEPPTGELAYILQDLFSIYNFGLITRNDNISLLGTSDGIVPAKMVPTFLGERFFQLLNLIEIDESKFDFIQVLKC